MHESESCLYNTIACMPLQVEPYKSALVWLFSTTHAHTYRDQPAICRMGGDKRTSPTATTDCCSYPICDDVGEGHKKPQCRHCTGRGCGERGRVWSGTSC